MRGIWLSVILAASAIVVGGVVLGTWRLPPSAEIIEPIDCRGWNTKEFFNKITAREVSRCLEMGMDVRVLDTDGATPLYWALRARNPDPDVVEVLLTAGAEVNEKLSIQGVTGTPLLVAAGSRGGASALRLLLEAGADTAFRSVPKGLTALHLAAMNESWEGVSLLLEYGAEANAEDDEGETPLMKVVDRLALVRDHHGRIANDIWTIRALLQHGADASALTDHGWTEVHKIALTGDNPDELAAVINQGLDPTAEISSGWQALHLAALANEDSRIVSTLLDLGVNPNSAIGDATTIKRQRHLSEIGYPPPTDSRIGDGRTPLHCAAFGNPNPDVIAALIEGGANPSARTTVGWTPLHAAVLANPSAGVVAALLEGGADPDAQIKAAWKRRDIYPDERTRR